MKLGLFACLLVLAMSSVASPAGADPAADAGKRFDRGLVLFKQRKFLEAANAFHDAYRLSPHGDALYNAGMAWEGAGMRALAATAFARALDEGVRPNVEAKVRAHLAALERHLVKVVVKMPPGSSVQVDVLSLAGERVVAFVEPGQQSLTATLADGQRVTRSINAAPGDSLTEAIEPPKPPEPPKPEPVAAPKPRKDAGAWRTAGYVSLGVATVATGAAILFGLSAVSARDEFKASGQTDRESHDRAVRNMHATNVCWGVAAAGAVGGGVLLFYVVPKVEATHEEKSGSLTLFGRF